MGGSPRPPILFSLEQDEPEDQDTGDLPDGIDEDALDQDELDTDTVTSSPSSQQALPHAV